MDRPHEDTKDSIIKVDLLIARRGGSFTSNVSVLRETVGEDADNVELRDLFRGQLKAVGARDITPTRRAELDDEEAFTYTYAQRSPVGGSSTRC